VRCYVAHKIKLLQTMEYVEGESHSELHLKFQIIARNYITFYFWNTLCNLLSLSSHIWNHNSEFV